MDRSSPKRLCQSTRDYHAQNMQSPPLEVFVNSQLEEVRIMSDFNPQVGPLEANGKGGSVQSPQSMVVAIVNFVAAGTNVVAGLNVAVGINVAMWTCVYVSTN